MGVQGWFQWEWSKNCPKPVFLFNIVLLCSERLAALQHCLRLALSELYSPTHSKEKNPPPQIMVMIFKK